MENYLVSKELKDLDPQTLDAMLDSALAIIAQIDAQMANRLEEVFLGERTMEDFKKWRIRALEKRTRALGEIVQIRFALHHMTHHKKSEWSGRLQKELNDKNSLRALIRDLKKETEDLKAENYALWAEVRHLKGSLECVTPEGEESTHGT